MQMIEKNIKWIMLVSGIFTCSMLLATIAPQFVLLQTFGVTMDAPLANIVVRNWGFLIALVGALLIYGAYKPESRTLILVIASISKLVFIVLVLIFGRAYLGKAGLAVGFDIIVVLLYVIYLLQTRRAAT